MIPPMSSSSMDTGTRRRIHIHPVSSCYSVLRQTISHVQQHINESTTAAPDAIANTLQSTNEHHHHMESSESAATVATPPPPLSTFPSTDEEYHSHWNSREIMPFIVILPSDAECHAAEEQQQAPSSQDTTSNNTNIQLHKDESSSSLPTSLHQLFRQILTMLLKCLHEQQNLDSDQPSPSLHEDRFVTQLLDLLQPCLLSLYGTAISSLTHLRDNDIVYLSLDGPRKLSQRHHMMMMMAKMGVTLDFTDTKEQWYEDESDYDENSQSDDEIPHYSAHRKGIMSFGASPRGASTRSYPGRQSVRAAQHNRRHPLSMTPRKSSAVVSGLDPVSGARRTRTKMSTSLRRHGYSGGKSLSTSGSSTKKSHHPLSNLPGDLFVAVLTFMSHDELFAASLVCKRWYKTIMDEDIVWRELCANIYYEREREKRRRRALEQSQKGLKNASENEDDEASSRSVIPSRQGNTTTTTGSSDTVGRPGPLSSHNSAQGEAPQTTLPGGPAGGGAAQSSTTAQNGISPQFEIPLNKIHTVFRNRKRPPIYRRWKTYYRYYMLYAGVISWDTTQCGPSIKFKNNNRTVFREDSVSYHWQTVRASRPIVIPTEEEQKRNGTFNPSNVDDMAIYEWEVEINRFDKTNSNGWWIVFGLETEQFQWRDSTPSNLLGYDSNTGWGYATNGDCLHCYSNPTLKFKQQYTCQPIQPFQPRPYKQRDIVKARLKYCTKYYRDILDPNMWIGATLEFFLNGEYLGQAYRNICGTVYPALSVLTNQCVTLRVVDPIAEEFFTGRVYQ